MDAATLAVLERERTKRQFITTLGAALGVEQSFAETDGLAVNYPGQYGVYGGAGWAAEGQPQSQQQAQNLMPWLLLIAGGFVLWKFVK